MSRALVFRFLGAYVILTVAFAVLQAPLSAAFAPGARAGLSMFAPGLEVEALSVRDCTLSARVKASEGPRWFRLSVQTNARPMLVGPLLTLSLLVAWGFRTVKARGIATLSGSVLTVLLSLHELAVAVQENVNQAVGGALGRPPASTGFYPYLLESGGRQLLALAAAGAGITIALRLEKSIPAVARSAPSRRRVRARA